MKCADTQGAQAFCPVRSKALKKWINSTKHVSVDFVDGVKKVYSVQIAQMGSSELY